jgi:hypothetical protein
MRTAQLVSLLATVATTPIPSIKFGIRRRQVVRDVTFDEEMLGMPTRNEVRFNDFAVAVMEVCATATTTAENSTQNTGSASAVDEQITAE